jgi:hypothetical protein
MRSSGVQGLSIPAPAGLAFRETGLSGAAAAAAAAGPATQQQLGMAMSTSASAYRTSSSSMDVSMDATSEQGPHQQQQHMSVAMPGQQQQQHVAGHPPLCPSSPHGHVRSEAEMRRTSSVIAMMQVTVTEALGFN